MKNPLLYILLFFSASAFGQTIAGGWRHSLAICTDSTIMAWGYNYNGQLGNGLNGVGTDSNVPISVNSLTGVIAVSAGMYHSLALKSDGTVWAWGANNSGQLGDGTNINNNVPVQVSSLTGIIAIAAGGAHSLALKNDSTVWSWGRNDVGQLGNGNNNNSNVPVQVNFLTEAITIAAGGNHSLALKNDGKVRTWGSNQYGQLGNGAFDSNIPILVSPITGMTGGITAIAAGFFHSIALRNDSTIWAWGNNLYGQLGNGNNNNINLPNHINSFFGVIKIGGGTTSSYATKNDGTAWAWGSNFAGELGNGNNINSNVPVFVNSLTGIIAIDGGGEHSLALKNDGTVWSSGFNLYGQLGNGTNTDTNVALRINGLCQVSNAVNEITEEASVTVYPNPSEGIFTIKMEEVRGNMADGEIKVYNMMGELVFSSELQTTHYILDLRSKSKGIYFIKVIADGKVYSQKVVIE